MASRWLPVILALEIESAGWQANSSVGNTQPYPRDEHCQSAVGSASDPWRVAEARHRDRLDQRRQIRGQAKTPAVPRLENIYPQSCRRHRGDGSICRADNLVSPALWMLIMGHGRRHILWFGVTAHPTAEGSQIRSRKHAAGNRLPAISFVTGMGPMVRSLSADSDR